MRLGYKINAPYTLIKDWHLAFAWLPVETQNGEVLWLEDVEKQIAVLQGGGTSMVARYYRRPVEVAQ